MKRVAFLLLIACYSFLQASQKAADPLLEYQKDLSGVAAEFKRSYDLRAQGRERLYDARKQEGGISPEDYQFLKGTSGVAASGARWAHEEGVLGQGVVVLLLEDSGVVRTDVPGIEVGSANAPATAFQYKEDHGAAMASLIYSIAPQAMIRVRHIGDWEKSLDGVRIINASFSSDFNQGLKSTFGKILSSSYLLVQAAGNSKEDLSTDPYTRNCEALVPNIIFVGNLRQDYKSKTSSGVPGNNPLFQDSFLWVIADDVITASGPNDSTQYSPTTGTSNAAAISSGAAALILSKYPTLNTADLKEILLESADREIFQLYGSGYDAVHVAGDASADGKATSMPKVPYDKSFWGKGVLSIRNALIYAALKQKSPGVPSAQLRKLMLDIIHRIEKKSASKIQEAFRKRVYKPTVEMLATRSSLTVNTSIPARQFQEAPGSPSSPPIPEQSDAERLSAQGITLPATSKKGIKVIDGVPEGASPALRAFIVADASRKMDAFKTYFSKELLPILQLDPKTAAETIVKDFPSLLAPFMTNRIVYLGYGYTPEYKKFSIIKSIRMNVTLVDFIYDGLKLNSLVEINLSDDRIYQFSKQLFDAANRAGLMNGSLKAAVLSVLNDFCDYSQHKDRITFIIDRDLLDAQFLHPDTYAHQLKTQLGVDCFGPHYLADFLKTATTTQKVKLKSFFQSPKGSTYCAEVGVKHFGEAFHQNTSYDATRDFNDVAREAFYKILNDVPALAPTFHDFLQNYIKGPNQQAIVRAIGESSGGTFGNYPDQMEKWYQELAQKCLVLIQ